MRYFGDFSQQTLWALCSLVYLDPSSTFNKPSVFSFSGPTWSLGARLSMNLISLFWTTWSFFLAAWGMDGYQKDTEQLKLHCASARQWVFFVDVGKHPACLYNNLSLLLHLLTIVFHADSPDISESMLYQDILQRILIL